MTVSKQLGPTFIGAGTPTFIVSLVNDGSMGTLCHRGRARIGGNTRRRTKGPTGAEPLIAPGIAPGSLWGVPLNVRGVVLASSCLGMGEEGKLDGLTPRK